MSFYLKTRSLFILLLLNMLFIAGCTRMQTGRTPPAAENGVLDLTGWDVEKDGPVKLEGDWEFYWEQLVKPADFLSGGWPRLTGYLARVNHLRSVSS